jgi:uncharacterized protein (DUF362 family)
VRRRDFLSTAAAAALARSFAWPFAAEAKVAGVGAARADAPRRARVACAVFPTDCADFTAGIGSAMAALSGATRAAAWESIVKPDDRVAIKLNCLSGPRLSPNPKLVDAIVHGVASAGVRRDRIILFDRSSRELVRAGFTEARADGDVRCFGTDVLAGGGYGDQILEHRSIGSLFTRILTDHATVLINVGVCKDHDLCGISAGLKNLYGLIHNPNRYHANLCDPFLADLADHPAVRPKLRLTIVDATTAQCHGGPAFNPLYTFLPGRVIVTRDPLAADVIAHEWIAAERAKRGLPTLTDEKRFPSWIETAERLGIGAGERRRIEMVEVEG